MNIAHLQVKTTELFGPRLDQLRTYALGLLAVGAVLTAIGAFVTPAGPGQARFLPFFHAYLYAYLFWFGVTAGSLGLLMLHHVVGGGWGYLIRRFLEAATRLIYPIPWIALLFIPVLIGLLNFGLYEWTHSDHEIVQKKHAYLNIPFFLGRTIFYFVVWWLLARFFNKWGDTQDERADPAVSNRLNVMGAAGLVIYFLTMTFTAVDWIMSLTPEWYSSIFAPLVVVSQALSTLSLMILLLAYLASDKPLLGEVPSGYFRDLGNLTLAFVLLWAYMSFGQYLIIYSGNIAEEVTWYLDRAEGGWGYISLALIPFHFALPFLILLVGSTIKHSPRRLAKVMAYLVVMRFVDLFWWITPTFRDHLGVSLADLGTPLLIGGVWLLLWTGQIRDRYLVPLHDPRLEGALTPHGVAEHV